MGYGPFGRGMLRVGMGSGLRGGTARDGRAALAGVTVRNGRTATRSCKAPRGALPPGTPIRGGLPRTPAA